VARRGVRYYRSVPPPEGEWEQDYAAIARAGLEFVVVPVPWALSHLDDERLDFSPLLGQLGLAHGHGIQVVADVDIGPAPVWLVQRHPEFLYEYAGGGKAVPCVSRAVQGGWWPGLCLDNEGARAHAARFLGALAAQAGGHPSLAGYQVAPCSELEELLRGTPLETCRCAASFERFVCWLRRRYADDLDALGSAWSQRLTDWSDVAPLCHAGQLPPNLDWRRFQVENAAEHLQWCVAALREADAETPIIGGEGLFSSAPLPDAAILARTVSASDEPLDRLLPHESVEWTAPCRRSRPVWLTGLPTGDARAVRLTHWSALVAGADALVYDAWRPERFFPSRQAGLARPDGAPSERLASANWFADLAARHPQLATARPYPAEAAVGVAEESWLLWAASFWEREGYFEALLGAYRALGSRGAQVTFAAPEQWTSFPLVYLPLALCMSEATADALRRYVRGGGCLVAEACTARFDESGLAGRASPGLGLDELFGARGIEVRDVAPGAPAPAFRGRHGSFPCVRQWEPLEPTTGVAKARFTDGTAAIVDHTYGDGATRLIATHPSLGCASDEPKPHARVVLDSLAFARLRPRVLSSSPDVCVRLLRGEHDASLLCAFNTGSAAQEAKLRVSRAVGRFRRALHLTNGKEQRLLNNGLKVRLEPGDGLLLRLDVGSRLPRLPRWRRRSREQL